MMDAIQRDFSLCLFAIGMEARQLLIGTFCTVINRDLHMPRALLGLTSCFNPFTIHLTCSSSKCFIIANFLSLSWKCSISKKVWPIVDSLSLGLRAGLYSNTIGSSWSRYCVWTARVAAGLKVEFIVIWGTFSRHQASNATRWRLASF